MTRNMNFYYFSICHLCKKPNQNLKKCSNCKVLYYCCRNHQLLDWPSHKNVCKAIAKTSKLRIVPPDCGPSDFNHFKFTSSLLWRYELGRDLDFCEQQMWMFPKVCSVCFKIEADIVCKKCLSVVYCSEDHKNVHKETHEKFCQKLKLCLVIYQTISTEMISTDWLQFAISKNVQTFPDNVEDVIKLMGFNNPADYSKKHVDYIIMSEYFNPAINILYTLEKSGFVQKRYGKKRKLTVHIVGPDESKHEISWLLIIEFIAHWILNMKLANIILIGPQVSGDDTVAITVKCEECQARQIEGVIVRVKGLYHDHIHSVPRPDVVVAFNSGLHEFAGSKNDTWKLSIPKLIEFRGIPTMLTAYTANELCKDLAIFKESHFSYLVKPQLNPYASLRPNRNWEEGSEPVFYQNGYVAVINKK